MGYIRHNSIIVTSWSPEYIKAAHIKACSVFKWVSPVSPETMNGYSSFFIPPDGSKEGWDESDIGDTQRKCFINWVKEQSHEDGSNSIDAIDIGWDDEKINIDNTSIKEV